MSVPEPIDFVACVDAMRRAGLPFSPTEAHAIAIGMLAGQVADRDAFWQAEMYAELDPADVLAQECRAQLEEVRALAEADMDDVEFGLKLLLPPEGYAEYIRPMALRDWARGFLYGFGLAGEGIAAQLSEEGREALGDFYNISQLDAEQEDISEEDEEAMSEIEEYMRVAAMLIFEDTQLQSKLPPPNERH